MPAQHVARTNSQAKPRRQLTHIGLLVALLALVPASVSPSQSTNPKLLNQRWKAEWIACPGAPPREFGVYHFRKVFSLDSVPAHFVVHVSADNRYWLFVNGVRVVEGPARGDLDNWRFETVDIARYLQAGRNVLAAVVWNFAENAPMAQMTNETGFLLQGDGESEAAVNTDKTWKVKRDEGISLAPINPKTMDYAYTVVGAGERVDGAKYPWGWEATDYDESNWSAAEVISPGGPRGIQDSPSRWMLVPRSIPLMEEQPERLTHVVRTSGVEATDAFLEGHSPLTVPAQTHATLLVDRTHLTTAYPEIVTSGGRGAEIALTYAEALFDKNHQKRNRNDIQGKQIAGYQDFFLPDGGPSRVFRPLYWRTFRYVQIDITTTDQPLVLEDFRDVFTAYPFTVRASFKSDDPELAKMWDVGWRTARLCAHETYMDCPYYEQLQYAGDTRIQALVSLYMTGDDRLVKNAIESLNESRTPEGLTQSRYPSFLPQYIPPFSLLWIGMMHDLWWYHGDAEFLANYLTNTRGVLDWFERRLTPAGLLGQLEWWDFADWNKDFKDGVPPQEMDGQSAILSLQFVMALRDAADLEAAFGSNEQALHYRALAEEIVQAVRDKCWDVSRHLLADTPAKRQFSQHANILGVLASVMPEETQKNVMMTALTDPSLTQCSYYFRYYLFRAMKKAGLGDAYLAQLGPWRQMLGLGLSTWAETPEPTRSDCHAWSAHPNFDLLATVAGIESAAPGFRQVEIAPHLGSLQHLEATLPHPEGTIAVRYERDPIRLSADITLPARLTGWFDWDGRKVELHGGQQHLEFSSLGQQAGGSPQK